MAQGYNGSTMSHAAPDLTGLSDYSVHLRVIAVTLSTANFRIAFAADNEPTTPRESVLFGLCQAGLDRPLFGAFVDNTGGSTSGGSSFGTGVWKSVVMTRSGTAARGYIDNAQVGSDVMVGSGSADLPNIRIGCHFFNGANGQFANCHVADVAIWDVELTSADRAALAAGVSPLLVRPGSLLRHYPMIRELIDVVGGTALMVSSGAPTVVEHPRVYLAEPPVSLPFGDAGTVQVFYTTSTAADYRSVIGTPWFFETTTGNTGTELVDEDLEFETETDLYVYSGGSIDAGPSAGPFEFETVTLAGQQALFSPPTLVSYATVTAAGQSLSIAERAEYTNVTGARIEVRMRIDGRIDLLDARRYRR